MKFLTYQSRIEQLFEYFGNTIEFYLQFNAGGSKYIATHYSTEIETKIKEFHKIIETEVKAQAHQYYLLKSLSYSRFNEAIYFPKFEISQCEPDFINNLKNILTFS